MSADLRSRPWLAKYPRSVPPEVDIPPGLLPDEIHARAERWPERAAIIYYGARWSYRRLWEESGRFAAALQREGVAPGDRVALYLPNCPAYAVAFLGILRAGATVTQVSPLYHDQDLLRLLDDAAPAAVVTLEILYPNVAQLRDRHPIPVVFVARLREFYPVWTRPFVNLVLRRQHHPTAFPHGPEVRPWRRAVGTPGTVPRRTDDPATTVAVLQYTGGTTGVPRGAMLTHRNLVANLAQGDAWNTTRRPGEEVVLGAIPFFHVYGLTVALLLGLWQGASIVVQTRPDVPELLKLIDRYHPTQFPAVPALYQALLARPDLGRYNLRSIRYCLSGSAPLPVDVQRRFEATTGAAVVEGYGLSETSPVTHVNPVEGERRPGSIGLPLPNTDQRVVDLDDPGRVLGTDEVGELAVRGPQVMRGYFQQPEETRRVLVDGWLRTGDVARIDADGYAYIVDRKKDVVIVGGLKVYPREVEEVLYQHAGVAEAAVVGVPDPVLGEVPKAFVVRRAGAEVTEAELIAFVRDRIAHFKAPRTVEFRDSLPRTGVQKVLRRALRAPAEGPAPTAPAR